MNYSRIVWNWPHLRGVTKRTNTTVRRMVSARRSTARNSYWRNSRSGRIKKNSRKQIDELSKQEIERKSAPDGSDLMAQISALQERADFFEEFKRISRSRLSMQWKIVSRSFLTGRNFLPPWFVELRTKHGTRRRKSARKIGRRFWHYLRISHHSVWTLWKSSSCLGENCYVS